jgi:hypothetical protein
MEAISRGPLPHQLSGKQQLAALGIRQPLASPFAGESVLAAASEPPQPNSPSGGSQQRRSQVGLSRVSLTHWLQDGEEARSPRGSLAKQPELVLDPEAADSGSGAAQLDNLCDSVSETGEALAEAHVCICLHGEGSLVDICVVPGSPEDSYADLVHMLVYTCM